VQVKLFDDALISFPKHTAVPITRAATEIRHEDPAEILAIYPDWSNEVPMHLLRETLRIEHKIEIFQVAVIYRLVFCFELSLTVVLVLPIELVIHLLLWILFL